ncbi:hypothetical protein [Puniceibacterium sp. IMCC21224]|uniref:hypothetical protein n=1 Tax=Puniceibacterium sp. IMCC21224 TaxID=1618204 RepID=UPI00065D3536|nr:hypothetical protein [Puniceibacterium sp. IMCC21224]KMK65674.1 hypothetical protein IMCC21224_11506 [Puniceibacterium sp. IMCC21224]
MPFPIYLRRFSVLLIPAFLLPQIVVADEVTDALQSALSAYEDGDVQYAIEELDFARNKLLALKTDALGGYLPAAPEGWTREDDEDMNAGLAMMGGGVGAQATYTDATASSTYTITMMADNPMVAGMSAMVANAAAMGMTVERIGSQRFAIQDGQIMGLVGNRILVQAEGADKAAMLEALGTIDYTALANFGQ